MAHKPIYVLNGPNLNLLGQRETNIYGSQTLDDIKQLLTKQADQAGYPVQFSQTNHEGEIIDQIHHARDKASAIIINAGAYTHSSIAIMDALKATDIPIVEVHLSNIYQREEFRHKSYISPTADGVICGFGATSYTLALEAVIQLLNK